MLHAPRRLIALTVPVFLAVAVPLLFVCCTPQWLSDSSGFVYVGTNGVVWYDLKTKKATKIVDAEVQSTCAGIWPTGDRVAVSKFKHNANKTELQILVYDLKGNKEHESPKHQFEAPSKEIMLFPTTHVSADKKHVLVSLPANHVAVTYNIETGKFRVYRDLLPIMHYFYGEMAMLFHVSPITPDGSRFLAGSADGKKLLSIDWEGRELREFTAGDEVRAAIERGREFGGDRKGGVATGLRWEMGILTARMYDRLITVNPRQHTVSATADAHAAKLAKHSAEQQAVVIGEFPDGALVQVSEKDQPEIQLWRPGGRRKTVLVADVEKNGIPTFIPSPDRELLIVRLMGDKDRVKVIDSKGKIVADLEGPLQIKP